MACRQRFGMVPAIPTKAGLEAGCFDLKAAVEGVENVA